MISKVGHDNAWVETVSLKAAVTKLFGERKRCQDIRSLGLAIATPFVVGFTILIRE